MMIILNLHKKKHYAKTHILEVIITFIYLTLLFMIVLRISNSILQYIYVIDRKFYKLKYFFRNLIFTVIIIIVFFFLIIL